jgi:hypothetical protein
VVLGAGVADAVRGSRILGLPRSAARAAFTLPVEFVRACADGAAQVIGTRWHLPAETEVSVWVHVHRGDEDGAEVAEEERRPPAARKRNPARRAA